MSEYTHGEYEVSDGQKRYYTPITEDIQRAYISYTQPSMSDSGELFYGTSVEFDRWLIAERERVAKMATEKERNRVISTLQKTIDDCPDADFCEECDITRYHMSIIMSPVTLGKIK